VLERIAADVDRNVWIHLLPREDLLARAAALDARNPEELPLYGVPFAIKDNIDLAGVPTTAGCPAYAYTPERSAPVVERLLAAGAIPIGKTNLDQFATGLVGVRSPHGAARNGFDPEFIAGGSSAGSAVAVARGQVSFSLGTDTAGSGRVPAAFNNLVGIKPTRGLLSTSGVVPACRSLDCVSIFSLNAADAAAALAVAQGFDADDPYSRAARPPSLGRPLATLAGLRVGVPMADQLLFFGDQEYERLFAAAVDRLSRLGAIPVAVDLQPFLEAARLLYEGPWVAERYAAVGEFIDAHPDSVHPVTREIIAGGPQFSAVDAFVGQYRLAALRRTTASAWGEVDAIITPTAGTIYRFAEVDADPVRLNSNLGHYTNFMNLLDLSAVAMPAGFRADGLPFGVTLFAPAFHDAGLLALADEYQRDQDLPMGATGLPLPKAAPLTASEGIRVVVCGAHMEGLPLNTQLIERGARLLARTATAPCYRFYALPGGPPVRPGLVRDEAGAAIEVEVWEVPSARFGDFVDGIPAPLGIGRVELADGSQVAGFLCESASLHGAEEITRWGGWRAWLARDQQENSHAQ
jgi:allophanate hydrolase